MIENWIELIIGAMMIISPWLLGFANLAIARWGNVIFGLVLVLANIWSLYGNPPEPAMIPVKEKSTTKKLKNNKSRVTI